MSFRKGLRNHLSKEEFVKECASCGQKSFPQYSPAVIVLVMQGEKILLGGLNDEKEMYSTLAGFVEAGETCEAVVRREVFEETEIKISPYAVALSN